MQLFARFRALRLAGALRLVCALALLGTGTTRGAPPQPWALARDAHFEVYSQDGVQTARQALTTFERLRACFEQRGLPGLHFDANGAPVRVIGFRSETEYDGFRLRPTADAYYSGDDTGDYIALASLAPEKVNLAAHEYAHVLLHRTGATLPVWLGEGLAEYFSTVRLTNGGCELGGGLPAHIATLEKGDVPPLADLLALNKSGFARETRPELAGFYAESWALASTLIGLPPFAGQFNTLLAKLQEGVPAAQALSAVYARPLATWERELRRWGGGEPVTRAAAVSEDGTEPQVSMLSELQSEALLADLSLASGQTERAQSMYRDLARRNVHAEGMDARIHSMLGKVALRRGENAEALREWKQAIDEGLQDAFICYQYASLASESGTPSEEVRAALERAVALEPAFADARYELALLESNAGEFAKALANLGAMAVPKPPRAFHYWCATANALIELDRRDEAKAAAERALATAKDDGERSRARLLTYLASTDLVSRYETDANGERRLVTARVPHGTTDFNPFVEPKDNIQKMNGTLREVQCSEGRLSAFVVKLPSGPATLTVPDPKRVLMRNAPAEFTCGEQPPRSVSVEFAAQGNVLRGMQFAP